MYGLKVDVIPPDIPCQRVDQPPMIFLSEAEKEEMVENQVLAAHKRGRPVLLGTRSVEESERYARLLARRGVSCQVLNARDDRAEAEIIASAGDVYKRQHQSGRQGVCGHPGADRDGEARCAGHIRGRRV